MTALRRSDTGEDAGWVRVSFAHTDIVGRGIVVRPPKSRAGVRTVVVPKAIRPDVVAHLREFTGESGSALGLHGREGERHSPEQLWPVRRLPNLVAELGMRGVHFHDLRHACNVWAAQTRVSTRDLMARMGHDDMRAAQIQQRATQEAADRIADGLTDQANRHRQAPGTDDDDPDDGAAGALVPTG